MVLIPLGDDAPHARRDTPYVTYALIALNVVIFLWRVSVSHGEDIVFERHWGVVPALMFGTNDLGFAERFTPLVTYMFLHGGWSHIIGNMLFLWIFGDDIEDVILAWAALQIWHVITPGEGAVAWWAHIGGMLAGAALIPVMKQPGVQLWECIQQRTFVSPWDHDLRPPSSRIRP